MSAMSVAMASPDEHVSPGAAYQRHLASLALLAHVAPPHTPPSSSTTSTTGTTGTPPLASSGAGSTDVVLVAFGREYAAHRLVLVQAGFFNTLFCPDFREGRPLPHSSERPRIPIHFPDPNMSRPAWEFCLATLYARAPRLRLPGWANPRAEHPLGLGFPLPPLPEPDDCADEADVFGMPAAPSHWATPRFLMSLLAISTYLAIPSVTALALTYILASFTPYSVAAYVRFGLGLGISPPSLLCPCDDDVDDIDELTQPLTGWDTLSTPASRVLTPASDPSGPLTYGPASAKVSEAALCWLARWGGDLLVWEREIDAQYPSRRSTESAISSRSPTPSSTCSSRRHSDSLPASPLRSEHEPTLRGRAKQTPHPPRPIVWAFDPAIGLPSRTIRSVISSDSFYVPSEWHRYYVARDVVDWRRTCKRAYMAARMSRRGPRSSQNTEREDEDPHDEADDPDEDEGEYQELFTRGVYYTHMPFSQLSAIADDICSDTGQTYTPGSTVQRALWEGMRLRSLLADPVTTASLSVPLSQFAEPPDYPPTCLAARDERYFPVPEDETAKSGDSLGQLLTTMSGLSSALAALRVSLDDAVADAAGGSMGASGLAAQRDPFAMPVPLAQPVPPAVHRDSSLRRPALVQRAKDRLAQIPPKPEQCPSWRRCESSEPASAATEAWVPFEPMRFGVDFYSIDRMADRTRLYSPTVFYGGSWWNLYVVTVHKAKGIQLGIYLHRQNPNEDLPPVAPPPDVTAASTADCGESGGTGDGDGDGGGGGGGSGSFALPTLDLQKDLVSCPPPPKPYIDPRRSVRACFSIHCYSPLGNGLTRFSSGPDQFTLSQSWGWKSSSLLGTVFLADGGLASLASAPANRFRCVCTIALI